MYHSNSTNRLLTTSYSTPNIKFNSKSALNHSNSTVSIHSNTNNSTSTNLSRWSTESAYDKLKSINQSISLISQQHQQYNHSKSNSNWYEYYSFPSEPELRFINVLYTNTALKLHAPIVFKCISGGFSSTNTNSSNSNNNPYISIEFLSAIPNNIINALILDSNNNTNYSNSNTTVCPSTAGLRHFLLLQMQKLDQRDLRTANNTNTDKSAVSGAAFIDSRYLRTVLELALNTIEILSNTNTSANNTIKWRIEYRPITVQGPIYIFIGNNNSTHSTIIITMEALTNSHQPQQYQQQQQQHQQQPNQSSKFNQSNQFVQSKLTSNTDLSSSLHISEYKENGLLSDSLKMELGLLGVQQQQQQQQQHQHQQQPQQQQYNNSNQSIPPVRTGTAIDLRSIYTKPRLPTAYYISNHPKQQQFILQLPLDLAYSLLTIATTSCASILTGLIKDTINKLAPAPIIVPRINKNSSNNNNNNNSYYTTNTNTSNSNYSKQLPTILSQPSQQFEQKEPQYQSQSKSKLQSLSNSNSNSTSNNNNTNNNRSMYHSLSQPILRPQVQFKSNRIKLNPISAVSVSKPVSQIPIILSSDADHDDINDISFNPTATTIRRRRSTTEFDPIQATAIAAAAAAAKFAATTTQ